VPSGLDFDDARLVRRTAATGGDPVNYTLEYLKKKYKRVTTLMLMSAEGIPLHEWGAESIAGLPRQMRRHAERIAREAQEEFDEEQERLRKAAEEVEDVGDETPVQKSYIN
jgi:hypothetical protein